MALPSFVWDDWGGDHWFPINRAELPPPSLPKHCFSVAGWFGVIVPVISDSSIPYECDTRQSSPQYYVIPDMLAKNVGSVSDIANEQQNGFGSSDFAAAEVCKQGRVTGHPSALNSPATQVLV